MVKIEPLSFSRIIELVSGRVVRGELTELLDQSVTRLGEPLDVEGGGLAFITAESYIKDAAQTKAAVLVIQESFVERIVPLLPASVKLCIASSDAYLGLARLSQEIASRGSSGDWRYVSSTAGPSGIHSSAQIDPSAKIAPTAVVCEGAVIAARAVVLDRAVVGPQAEIGRDSVIFPGAVIYPRTALGARVRVHANAVLGSDGFGYARGPRGLEKIWHLGRVVVGDDVEIGAGTTIDRGTMKDTVIENGAKIDNLCQIGHNGHVGAHAVLCAQVGMAGNVKIGSGAILAGKVGVADKIEIGAGALVGPMSGLSKDVKPNEQVMGQQPAKPRREWWRLIALFERLPELYERVKSIEKRLIKESSGDENA